MMVRVAAGLIGLAVVLPALFLGGPVAVWVIVAFALLVSIDEYARMAFPESLRGHLLWMGFGVACVWAGVAFRPAVLPVLLPLVLVGTMGFVTLRPGERLDDAADRVSRMVLGIAWVSLITVLIPLRDLPQGEWWVFLALAVSWMGDTGAYFAGRFFGRAKLHPLVSPKKTWAGFWGGIASSALGVLLLREVVFTDLSLLDAVVLGGVGSAMGVLGDLSESLLKRAFGVKDSGWIMPGHGGLLDRIDSVLFVAPFIYGYLVVIKGMV